MILNEFKTKQVEFHQLSIMIIYHYKSQYFYLYLYIIFIRLMSSSQKNKRSTYKKITQQIRQEIIERILNNGQNIKQVAADLHINVSTCKAIIKVFQEEGRIGKKKRRNKILDVVQTFSFYQIKNGVITPIEEIKIEQSKVSFQRDGDSDNILVQNSKQKAQKILDKIISQKQTRQLATEQIQRQLLQMQMRNYPFMFYPNYNPLLMNPQINFNNILPRGSQEQYQPETQ